MPIPFNELKRNLKKDASELTNLKIALLGGNYSGIKSY